jgi:Phosphotransferase enzyme family
VKRISWDNLPNDLKDAIEKRTGRILKTHTATAGQNSPIAVTITTEHGKTFVKGLPHSESRSSSQAREVAVAPLVREISPHLHWHFEEAGWIVLGYQHVEGRHADYRPGSPDPDALLPLIKTLGEIEVPTGSGPFKLAEDRWKTYVDDPRELEIFVSATLQHTDWIPHNVLISPQRPYLIDWAWPTLGAAWMDPAYFLIRLMASGYSTEDAEAFAAQIPAFAKADPAHLDVFARVNVRMWDEIEEQSTGHISSWMRGVVAASRNWAKHRGVAVQPR